MLSCYNHFCSLKSESAAEGAHNPHTKTMTKTVGTHPKYREPAFAESRLKRIPGLSLPSRSAERSCR